MDKNLNLGQIKEKLLFLEDKYDLLIEESIRIISDKKSEFQNRNIDIGDTPISPMSLNDNNNYVFLSKEVSEEYKNIVSNLQKPDTALEYAYLLVGIKDFNNNIKIEFIFDVSKESSINNRTVEYDNEKINKIINSMRSVGCNFFSICHTHPLIPLKERKSTIANYLALDTLERECIRNPGLNLSLQDIIGYNILNQQIKNWDSSISFCSTVIMYNGEIVIFEIENEKIMRYVNIFDENTNKKLPVSSNENYMNKYHK